MTYWEFHFFFTFPALFAVLAFYFWQAPSSINKPRQLAWVVALAAIAFVYTTPWDNYLVKHAIWTYGPDRVSHVIGYVPIEEYAFFVLQPLVTGTLYLGIRNTLANQQSPTTKLRHRVIGFVALIAVTGLVLAQTGEPFRYMRLIVGWSVPIIAAQWLLGGDYFLQRLRTWLLAIIIPTAFFSIVDAIAIRSGIWDITAATSTGVMIGGLPIEEFLFFLLTNVLVVQGLMLFVPDPIDVFRLRRQSWSAARS